MKLVSHAAKFQAGWAAVNRGEIEAVVDLLHPEVEWDVSPAFVDLPVYRGHAGVRRFFYDVFQLWEEFRLEIDEIHERDDQVLVVGWWAARGRTSSVPIKEPGAWLWTMRGEKGAAMRFYSDPAQAWDAMQATPNATSRGAGVDEPALRPVALAYGAC
jgi:ketosteroid isomerase-like protein